MSKNMNMNGQSLNSQEDLLVWLKEKLPEAFTEGKIDPKKLKATLGESVDASNERYGLSWAGKSDCFRHIQEPTTATLKPVRDESVDFDTTQNIFIEGDNLQALKVLQKSYYGQVKIICIDPPYNTGSDSFIYPDRFQETQEEYMERVGDKEEGHVTRDGMWQKNSGDNGHYHSNWLSMMYPRLFLARNLLREDGVIFVCIDDNEVHNLRLLMNEIFGEENFIADIAWEKRYTRSNDAKLMASVIDHILLYRKTANIAKLREPRTEKSDSIYSNPDNDPRGPWTSVSYVSQRTKAQRPNLSYKVKNPVTGEEIEHATSAWKFSSEQYQNHLADNRLYWGEAGGHKYPRLKKYLSEMTGGLVPINLWKYKETGTVDDGTREVDTLLGNSIFDYPKPTSLIRRMLQMATDNESEHIILDFFAGSGTTAHAVMALNAEDGGNRKYISIQINEPCEESSEAKKVGFNTIAEISKERIRRAGKKIKKETNKDIDYGFKVFKLDESNFKIWRNNITNANELAEQMHMFVDNLKTESTQENVLYELMLKTGLDVNVPVETKQADGKKYFVLDNGKLVVCLEDAMTQTLADAVIAMKPQKVICIDGAFKGNDQLKTNTALQMEAAHIDFRVI